MKWLKIKTKLIRTTKFKLPKPKPVEVGLGYNQGIEGFSASGITATTCKMVTAFPDDYCPDIPFPDGSCCMDYCMDIVTGEYICDPGWWKKIPKEFARAKTKAQRAKELKDEQKKQQEEREQDRIRQELQPKPKPKQLPVFACDNCQKYREMQLWSGKGKNRKTRMANICGFTEIAEKKKECGEQMLKEG